MNLRVSPLIQSIALLLLTCCTYLSSFDGAFTFDDRRLIIETPNVEHTSVLELGYNGSVAAGRPLVAASFLLNIALDPLRTPFGYHVFNLFVHACSALLVLGWMRRTLASQGVAFAVALIWALHPIHTGAVTYIAQRAESLMSMFALAALYCSTRSRQEPASRLWPASCVLAAFAGVLSKEVAVVIPLLVLIHDRIFFAASYRAALRGRAWLYAGLAASWIVLGLLVMRGARAQAAGFDMQGMNPLNYGLTQFNAVVLYLKLMFWPDKLIIDYGWPVVPVDSWRDVPGAFWSFGPNMIVVCTIGVLGLWALVRARRLGFAAAWFFLLLGPSSSILPLPPEIMAEHRMYLPSLAVITLVLVSVHRLLQRFRFAFPALVATLALLCATSTDAQNHLYASNELLLTHNVLVTPDNQRALMNLGRALLARGEVTSAASLFERAVASARACRRPRQIFLGEALDGSASAWKAAGDLKRANAVRAEAWELDRTREDRALALAAGLRDTGEMARALAVLRETLGHAPDSPALHAALLATLLVDGQLDEARREAQRLAPRATNDVINKQLAAAAERLGHPELARALAGIAD